MMFRVVVLPAPLGPISPVIVPAWTPKVTPRSTCSPPSRLVTCCSSRIRVPPLNPGLLPPADVWDLPAQTLSHLVLADEPLAPVQHKQYQDQTIQHDPEVR